jgi:hypothetical protein
MLDPNEARKQREKANRERQQRKSKASAQQKTRTAARKVAKDGLPTTPTADEPFPADIAVHTVDGPSRVNMNRKRPRQTLQQDGEDINDEDDEDTPSGLHPDDPANFLKLCRALRLLMSRKITDQQINEADQLLRSYCLELIEVSFLIEYYTFQLI